MGHQSYFKLLSNTKPSYADIESDDMYYLFESEDGDPVWIKWENFEKEMCALSDKTGDIYVIERTDYDFDIDSVYIFVDGKCFKTSYNDYYENYCHKCYSSNKSKFYHEDSKFTNNGEYRFSYYVHKCFNCGHLSIEGI